MKWLSFILVMTSFSLYADETCFTSLYDFSITPKYIEVTGQGETARISVSSSRSLARRNRSDFKHLIATLSHDVSTDVILTQTEALVLERFAMIVAEGNEEIIGMIYAKGYDQNDFLVVRYMVTEDGAYRCK